MKLQVFELLCAICMFSASGHALALDALQHYKVSHPACQRYEPRFIKPYGSNPLAGTCLNSLPCPQRLHGYRYRFDAVVMELRAADNPVYQATLLAFVNCLVLANEDLASRVRMRNELVGE